MFKTGLSKLILFYLPKCQMSSGPYGPIFDYEHISEPSSQPNAQCSEGGDYSQRATESENEASSVAAELEGKI